MNIEENQEQLFDSKEPDIDHLKADLERCRSNLGSWIDRASDASQTRRNEWPGKGRYGRKESATAWPWQNASDLEGNVVEPLIAGDVALLKSSLSKGNIVAAPVESGDIATAKQVTEFMRWRMSTMDELPREAGVAANYLLEQGIAFLGVYWKREVRRQYKPLTINEIAEQAPEVAQAIQDPEMKDAVSEMLQGVFPNLRKGRISKMITQLRKDGVTEIPTEKVVANRPAVRAYELGRDLILDSNVLDLQSARAIYCIHWLTPEQLREKVLTDGWSEDWVDEAIANSAGQPLEPYDVSLDQDNPTQFEGLVRLVTAYRREIDEDGVPICTTTIFNEQAEGFAKYSTLMYGDQYPFVAITREHLSRRLLDSRGYPELLRSYQIAVKGELDGRRDRASLSTVPPIQYAIGRRPEKLGPGSQVPVRRQGEVSYLDIPPHSPGSMEVEMQLRSLADKITGRPTGPDDAVEANLVRQSLVNNWLEGWKQILRQIWQLERTYGGPEIWFRVTNNEQSAQLILDETAEIYDFDLSFNTMNNDEEKVLKKLETVGTILSQYDRQGQARYDQFLRVFLDAIDPNLASKLIMPADEATTKEIIETSQDLAKIFSGQVVNIPEGANSQLRLQVVQQYLQGTQEIPAEDVQQRLQEDEKFAARISTYTDQLTFQQQQQRNALTGKLGAAPGNVPGSAMNQQT
jgi:hypothetical protein